MQITSVIKAGVFAAALGFASSASALVLNGSVTIGGGSFSDTTALDVRTDFSPMTNAVAGLNTSGVTGNFSDLGFSQPVTFSSFTTATPSTATTNSSFIITGGNFTFRADTVAVVQSSTNAADFFFLGTLENTVGGTTSEAASFRAAAVRNGTSTGGFTVNFGGVLAAPPSTAPVSVPEPASMALLGMGLLGLGLARRRKV